MSIYQRIENGLKCAGAIGAIVLIVSFLVYHQVLQEQKAKVGGTAGVPAPAERKTPKQLSIDARANHGFPPYEHRYACRDAAKEKLRSPSTAEFLGEQSYVPLTDGWTILEQFDAQNAFGATVRGTYTCIVFDDAKVLNVTVSG